MRRSHPTGIRLNVDENGRQNTRFKYHFGPSTSHLGSARMIDYPTPPRTQSPATSISGSSAPTTPSRGIGLLNCPFPSSLIDAYSTSASSSYHPATTTSNWSLPVSMCENTFEENAHLNLLPSASYAFSSPSLDASSFYKSPAVSSSSFMPISSASIDFAQTQHHIPAVLHSNFRPDICHPIKQEENTESWFGDHIDMERSQSSIDLSSYGDMKSPSLSPFHFTDARLESSSKPSFAALSPASCGQSQQFESSRAARSESVESSTTHHQVAGNQKRARGRRHSANGERRYTCSICNRPFDKKYNLKEHEKKHDPSRVSQFLCPEPGCGKRLGRKTDVNRHVQSVHEKAKNFACARCLKRFDRKDTLSR